MPAYICVTCGVQQAASDEPPATCAICADERQYVGAQGQRWTTLAEMKSSYRNVLVELEPGLVRIGTQPRFAIGQQAYLVRTPGGNVLWDCVSLVDEDTVEAVTALGGIAAIAVSHPHFYASCVEWSEAFAGAPILLPAVDRDFVMCPSEAIVHFADDEVEAVPGVRVIRLGGHFHGSTVLHWPAGGDGRGVLLTGDTIAIVADDRFVTFMYSYPNQIPLPAAMVRDIADRALRYEFDRIYAGWAGDVIDHDAKRAVRGSADRYTKMLEGTWRRS